MNEQLENKTEIERYYKPLLADGCGALVVCFAPASEAVGAVALGCDPKWVDGCGTRPGLAASVGKLSLTVKYRCEQGRFAQSENCGTYTKSVRAQ
jgi:3-oxoacyl-[acyl-carrier-protein] synthase III